MTDFTVDELLHERRMSEDGADRYLALTATARERGLNATTVPGRALVRRYILEVEAGLREFLKRSKKGPCHNALGATYIAKIPVKAVALLATVLVVDGLFGERSPQSWGSAIGSALEDEWRLRQMRKASTSTFADLKKRTRHAGPTRKRRTIMSMGMARRTLPPRWEHKARMAAGLACLEIIEARTQLIETIKIRAPKRVFLRVVPTQEATEWVARADEHAAAATAVYRPMIEPPEPWLGPDGGGYKTDLVLRRPVARFRGKGHEALVRATPVEQYQTALDGLNALQRIAWRVNEPVLEVLEHLAQTGLAPLDRLVRLPLPPRPPEGATQDEWARRNRKSREVHRENARRDGHRVLIGQTVRAARYMLPRGRFYMPHRLDFRGRAYPTPSWIQPQGPDIARGLLLFDEGAPMTPAGWEALMAWGWELGIPDLVDPDPHVGGNSHLQRASLVYNDPLEHASAWATLDEPFQALAWYLEVGAALEAGWPERPFITHLPCYVDASNNGLQLYALMTGDRDLARWTNVLPGEKLDLYTQVAAVAWETVLRDAEKGHDRALDIRGLFAHEGAIPRKCAKRPVMTMPYSVTEWSATDYVREWYMETYCTPDDIYGPVVHQQRASRYLARVLMAGVREVCPGAVAGMEWLQNISRLCATRGVPMRWTAPSGWPVLQEYRKRTAQTLTATLGGSIRKITIYRESGPADEERQRRGSAPNFVHSVDASIMADAVSVFRGPVAAVHDAFGTLAPLIPDLHAVLRASVVRNTLDFQPFDVIKAETERYLGMQVPEPPRLGTILPEEVMASTHFFG